MAWYLSFFIFGCQLNQVSLAPDYFKVEFLLQWWTSKYACLVAPLKSMRRRLSVLKIKLEEAALINNSTSFWQQWHWAVSPRAVCNSLAGVVLSFITRCLLLHPRTGIPQPVSSAEASIFLFQKPSVSFSSSANTDWQLHLLLELEIPSL